MRPPSRGAFVGAYVPRAPGDSGTVASYVRTAGKRPAILMFFRPWGANGSIAFDASACVQAFAHDAVPMLSWEPWDPGRDPKRLPRPEVQPAFRLRRIVGGEYDDYLRESARRARAIGGPIMLRPMHEMNGDWYPWDGTVNGNTPELFKKAWRHMHELFVEEGATNVTWVWSVNRESIPRTAANDFAAYYPGDAYVDWTGISGFNLGTSLKGSAWHPFGFIYRRSLTYLKTLGKPIVIAEIGSVADGGDKAAWIADAYRRLRTEHPEVKAVVYYDALDESPSFMQDWRIRGTPVVRAYRSSIAPPYFVGAPAETLTAWTARLSARDRRFLREAAGR